MYPIEVYKISKEHVVCESLHSLQVTSFDVDTYVTDRVGSAPKEARIKNEYWKIKLLTEGKSLGYGKHTRLDKYIAVDPVLEEILTLEHREAYSKLYSDHIKEVENCSKLFSEKREMNKRLDVFLSLPWYKRIYRAIKMDI